MSVNYRISSSYGARYRFIQKLASHFKFPKEVLIADANQQEESPVFRLPSLDGLAKFNRICYSTQASKINLKYLFSNKHFQGSDMYQRFLVGEGAVEPMHLHRYIMTTYLTGYVWVLYRAETYDGLGGIFVRIPHQDGMVIEPVKNYLSRSWPIEGSP